jgi:hypothetical protein
MTFELVLISSRRLDSRNVFVVGRKTLEDFSPFGLTIFVVGAVMQILIPVKVFGSKEALTSVPDMHPRLAILIEMIERSAGTVEDPLQRQLRKTRLITGSNPLIADTHRMVLQ